MKINVSSIFETTQIAKSRAFGELKAFFDYFSLFSSNVIRVLNNNIGINDNIDGSYQEYKMKHNTPLEISVKKEPKAIIISGYYVEGSLDSYIAGFKWKFTADKKVILSIQYITPSSNEINVKFVFLYS